MMCLRNGKGVKCVNPHDPQQCKPRASLYPAITFTFDQNIPWNKDEAWCKQVKHMAETMSADLVLLLPQKRSRRKDAATMNDRVPIPSDVMKYLPKYFRIVRTPWVVPPDLSPKIPREGG